MTILERVDLMDRFHKGDISIEEFENILWKDIQNQIDFDELYEREDIDYSSYMDGERITLENYDMICEYEGLEED